MITCDSLTVEKVEAELEALETAFKEKRKERKKRVRGAGLYCGIGTIEHQSEIKMLCKLEANYCRYARKLRALLAVLKEETPTDTKEEAKESQ